VRLLAATRSEGKQREIRRLLQDTPLVVVFPDDVGIHEAPAEDLLELGDSFLTNSRAKAEYFSRKSGLPTVADDAGLEVFALGGEPGVRSRRWAGVDGRADEVDAANNALLLRRLSGASETRRRARYRCVLVYYAHEGGIPRTFEGSCGGRILEAPQGSEGFGYDPLFWSDDLGKTFGEASAEEKDGVSHRGKAFRALAAALGS
jgi:XTP/dITP diphosphohydrolase